MIYGSVCSGIEAATVAWHPLGWKPAFFSEIEPFPSSLLAHRYPDTPNLGDMTKFKDWPSHAIDLLVGGTPCQSFSVAGLRAGLADPRGNLMLTYLAIAAEHRPRWLVWENVPGVLSSGKGRDFASLVGGMGQLGYGLAYRVLDAQFCRALGLPLAVPQRRRRVFVIGYLGDWRRAAAVLFDGASLRGDPPPRREAGKNVAPTLSARPTGGGGLGTDFDLDGGLIYAPNISPTLKARDSKGPSSDGDGDGAPILPIAFHGTQDPNVSGDVTHPLGRNYGQEASIAYGIRNDAARDGEALTPSADADGNVRLRAPGFNVYEGVAPTLDASAPHSVGTAWAVRRLTPLECERLQGFPDGYTQIPHRGKPAADGPRYKALGNSMAVNVMRVIGERIQMVEDSL